MPIGDGPPGGWIWNWPNDQRFYGPGVTFQYDEPKLPGLSDETIDRIAQRVADVLEQRAAAAANKAEYDEKVRRFEAGDWNA